MVMVVQAFHKAVTEMSKFYKQISVKNLLKIDPKQIAKLQHILYRKVREMKKSEFLKAIDSDNEVLKIVESGITSFRSVWEEVVPKTAAFTMFPPEFRIVMQNRLLLPHA